MPEQDWSAVVRGLPTGVLCDAHPDVRAMSASIGPLCAGARLAGPARTAATPPGHNAAVHRAILGARPGEVLVVDGGGSRRYGAFGDILASACRLKGVVGLVIDGAVRDVAELRAMEFPVFCLGANPAATRKTEPGEIDLTVLVAGILVSPGDYIVGDDSGVVVIPQAIVRDVARSAGAIAQREAEIMAELAAGKTTCEILDIPTEGLQ